MKFLRDKSRGDKIFWTIILVVFFLMLFDVGWGQYDAWKGQKAVEELAQELEKVEMERQRRMAGDTIGGRTPLETMNLYIEAVETGDYELASKYFVIEEQEKEIKILKNSPKENISNIIGLMKNTRENFERYSDDKRTFSVHDPILVSFVLYPSGNWKIEEI